MAEKGTITFSTALDNRQLEKDYQAAVKEVERLEKELGKRMRVAAAELNFEEAAVQRDRLMEVRKLLYDKRA